MADYRQLWLVNSLNQIYYLSDPTKNDTFLNNPLGFGFRRSYDVERVGNSEIVVSDSFSMTDITGEIVFYGSTNGQIYEDYQKFISFLKFKPLELHYVTPNLLNVNGYYSEILVTNISKGEVSEQDNMMRVSITMHRLTQWLNESGYNIVLSPETSGDGKNYPLERPYHYSGSTLSNTTINNTGTDAAGFILTIDGEIVNPQFTLNQNGVRYGICKILGTYDFVQIDSVERNESIYLERNGVTVTNPKKYQDFTVADGSSYLTWCKLKVGESIFTFTSGNIDVFDGTITISFKNSFASV